MKRWMQIEGVRYLIRGPWTATEVRARYKEFRAKYPNCELTLAQWAGERGFVFFKWSAR